MGCSFAVILLKSRDVFYLLKILEILDYYSLIPPLFLPPLAGQRLFRREGAGGSDSHSETSSVGQAEDLSKERVPQPTPPIPGEAVSVAPESSKTPQVPADPEPTQENGEVGTQEGEEEERQPEGQEAPVEETGR